MTKKRSCGRGVLQLETFKPCRRPGQAPNPNCVAQPICTAPKTAPVQTCGNVQVVDGKGDKPTPPQEQNVPPAPPVQHGKSPVEMLARYSYQANPDKPGGFDEMKLKQGQKLEFVKVHPSNPFWWEVKNEMDDVAFVPASYLVVLEKKVSALPWLQNKALEEEKERLEQERKHVESGGPFGDSPAAVTYKPYSSAYAKDSASDAPPDKDPSARRFYCEVCDKQLNGIKPYQAHMVSKAHKEEMDLLD